MKSYWGFLLLLFSASLHADNHWKAEAPGGFSAEVSYPSQPVKISELLPVTLKLIYPIDYQINLNTLKAHLQQHLGLDAPPFKLVSEQIESKKDQGAVIETVHFNLDPQSEGEKHFSFWTIHFEPTQSSSESPGESAKGKPVNILSDIFKVTVLPSPLPEPMWAPLLSLSPDFPIDISSENRRKYLLNPALTIAEQKRNQDIFKSRQFPWVGLFALAIALGLVMTSKRRSTRPQKSSVQKLKDVKKSALERLQTLNALIKNENYEQFYTDLTNTLHTFIEEYYNIPADTRTTEEFLHDLRVHPLFDAATQDRLQTILGLSDQIKFGHLPTTQEEGISALKLTREFIVGKPTHV